MSYPQPSSVAYQSSGFDFFRLTTELSSPGDIYESLVSSALVCVGPDSDIANVGFAYFDDQAEAFVSYGTISPMRGLAGQIYARLGQDTYIPSKRPGKILFWSDDLFDPNFLPFDIAPNIPVTIVTPVLDVIEYFEDPPSVTPQRPDKQYQYQEIPSLTTGYLVVPYYGRKSATVRVYNLSGDALDVEVRGVTFYMNPQANGLAQETVILPSAAVPNGDQTQVYITVGEFGTYHMLLVKLTFGGAATSANAPITIIVSDQSESPSGA